jgi:hypothetical protein
MADQLIEIGAGFWNVRGSLKVAGVLDVGTQMSLVQRSSGRFVALDCYVPDVETRQRLLTLTDGGRAVEAILNLHPFHTLHVTNTAALFPHAKLYGTERHHARLPHLEWQPTRTESPALSEHFGDTFQFSVPRGVDFVCPDERQHFASVLAFHGASGTLHVDDTLTWLALPLIGGLRFHPSLTNVLQRRPRAVAEFRSWLVELRALFAGVRSVCTAHMKPLPPNDGEWQTRLEQAIRKIEKRLAKHERRYA